MNRAKAKIALLAGKKLTHPSFTQHEWVKNSRVFIQAYVFEDGLACNWGEFWHYRKDDSFNSGWSEYE